MGTPEFILDLRKHVGHAMLWLPGADAVIMRTSPRPEVLLARRADTGVWDNVAGIVEPGEHPAETVVREAMEEAGVKVRVDRLLRVAVHDPVTYPNGDQCQFLSHDFACEWIGGDAHPADEESTEVAWFAPDDLPAGLAPKGRELIELAVGESVTPGTRTVG